VIQVSIIEDDKVIRQSLTDLLRESENFECSGAYPDCETAIADLANHRPSVILMDIELPGISGIEGTKRIREKYPKIDIVMLTIHEDPSLVFQALKAGACGYLDKSLRKRKSLNR